MRSILCFSVYVCIAVGIVHAEMLTLPAAVERALQRSSAIEIQRRVIQEADGVKTGAGLWPNPTLSYAREELSLAGLKGGEWNLSASVPLTFLWTRGSERSAADARIQAETLSLKRLQDQIRFEVQKAFVEYHYAREKRRAWQKVSVLVKTVLNAGSIRQAEGDISKYEHQRIALEALRYSRLETESLADVNRHFWRLVFLLDRQASDIETTLEDPSLEMAINLDTALDRAMTHRADLQASAALVSSNQAAVIAEERRGWPEIDISFGFKSQEDGFEGATFQADLELPFFNRNQGKVKTAKAASERQRLALMLLKKQVQTEVRNAFDQFDLFTQQINQMEQANISPDSILEIAQFAYSEGDMSLIEMLDGLQAYSGAFLARFDLLKSYYISRFELEKTIGQPLSELN